MAAFEPLAAKEMGEPRPTVHWDVVTYDAIMIVADALRRGGASTEALLASLAATKYEGVLGTYEFDADRTIKSSGFDFLFIRSTADGGFTVVK